MKIDHVALWVEDLEEMRSFYTKYFGMTSGERYHNPKRNFTSYFLSFANSEAKIELMHLPNTLPPPSRGTLRGLAHLSISVGSKGAVDSLTETFRKDGYEILSEPRTTGDGYYESTIADPEGNHIEITS